MAVRSVIGPRTECGQIAARGRIALLLDAVHAEHQPADAVVLVDVDDAVGELHRLADIAFDHQREERAVEQFVVLGIEPQRGAVIIGGGRGVAQASGVAGGQIAARGGEPAEFARHGRLRGKLDGRAREEYGERAAREQPDKARASHWRCSNGAVALR